MFLPLIIFVKFWGYENSQNGHILDGLKYARIEELIHNAESVNANYLCVTSYGKRLKF